MPFTHYVMIKLVNVIYIQEDMIFLIILVVQAATDADDRAAKAKLLKETIEGMNGQVVCCMTHFTQ